MLGIFLDTETNGLNPFKHRVVEIAFQMVDMETGAVVDSYEAVLFQSYEEWQKSDLQSLAVNGFDWEQVSYGLRLETVADQIRACFTKNKICRGESVFICQNPSFDRAFFGQILSTDLQEELLWPYHWLDLASMHWALSLKKKDPQDYPWKTGLSKDKIAKAYLLPKEKTPHRAMNGVLHLIACYEAVVGFPLKTKSS